MGLNFTGNTDLSQFLELDRCPHCSVSKPSLGHAIGRLNTTNHLKKNPRQWACYLCGVCGGIILAAAPTANNHQVVKQISEIYPLAPEVDNEIPQRARSYLQQALNSLSAPDGAVMLAASAVDAMLKAKNLTEGSLYSRIKQATELHIITKEMEIWAHQVRLDANNSRHADENNPHHDVGSAERAFEFAMALAQFMFVLPAKITRGIVAAGGTPTSNN